MSILTDLQARLAQKEASLAIANATYDKLLAEPNESYRFDSGEGSQSSKKRKLTELSDQIDRLESDIDSINRRISGRGLTKVSLRRKPY